ncbi:hypothetical protein HU200_015622 [Digitaria exilis]|uniref:Uncharacterized protein n=1 Tax=Digitaria exilis TaxID=1010633 RepID=A0A835F831_9POAL|nr:hypothetical protein HU200_015622 [Digitaria exilis]
MIITARNRFGSRVFW